MVKKGLKVGDTFEDGGRIYKVTKVLENGFYESTAKVDEQLTLDGIEKPKRRSVKNKE